jgi:hypothetical protein
LTSFAVAVVFAVRDLSSRINASTVELVTAVGVVVTVCAVAATETDPIIRALAP